MYHDLEMHTVHLGVKDDKGANPGNVKYAAMGIMFSVNDYNVELDEYETKVIEKFFEEMHWKETNLNPTVAEVPYGQLMMIVNIWDRWVYKGSVTTPPCDEFVYWNVLRTVYPIKQKTLDMFKK